MNSASASAMRSISDRSTLSFDRMDVRALIHRAPDQHLDARERLREHRDQRDRSARADLDRLAAVGPSQRFHRRAARRGRGVDHVTIAGLETGAPLERDLHTPGGVRHADAPRAPRVPRPGRRRVRAGGSRERGRRARSGSTTRRPPGRRRPARRRRVTRQTRSAIVPDADHLHRVEHAGLVAELVLGDLRALPREPREPVDRDVARRRRAAWRSSGRAP